MSGGVGSQLYSFYRGENPLRADKLNGAFSERVLRTGDTMLGPLNLARNPIVSAEAANKAYVDGIAGGGLLPAANAISVTALGAIGNGANDDTIPIRNAYTEAAARGYIVYFPAGRYRVTGEINTLGVNTNGDGPTESVIIRGDNTTFATGLLVVTNAQNFRIADIGFDGNKAHNTTSANGLYLDGCMDYVIENVRSDNHVRVGTDPFTGKGQGISLINTPTTSSSGRGVQLRNCECCFNQGAGLFIYAQGANISVLGGVFSHNDSSGLSFAKPPTEYVGGTITNPVVANTRCEWNGGHGLVMTGFTVFRGGINCEGHGNDVCVDAVVQGNQCNHNRASGMLLQVTGLTVVNNTCNYNGHMPGDPTYISNAGMTINSERVTVIGNDCCFNSIWGLDIGGTWKGTVSHNVFSKNTGANNPVAPFQPQHGVGINLGACQDVTVTHNIIEDNTQSGISFTLNDSGAFYFPWDTVNLTITHNIIINTLDSNLFGIFGSGLVIGVVIEHNTIYWPVDSIGIHCIQCHLGPNSRIVSNRLANLDTDIAVVMARAPQLVIPQWADQLLLTGGTGIITDIVSYPQSVASGHCTQIKMTNRGSGYTTAPTVTLTSGTWDAADPPEFTARLTPDGQVAACTIADGGTNVVGPVTVSLTGGGGSGATAVVTVGTSQPYGDTLIITTIDSFGFRLEQGPTLRLNIFDGVNIQTQMGMAVTLQWRGTAWYLVAMAGVAVRAVSYAMPGVIDNVTLPDTQLAVQKNTTTGQYFLRVNDGGTIRSLGPFV